jgi:hypothetical protein
MPDRDTRNDHLSQQTFPHPRGRDELHRCRTFRSNSNTRFPSSFLDEVIWQTRDLLMTPLVKSGIILLRCKLGIANSTAWGN